MKKLITLIILYSFLWILWTFLILCPSTKAQWEDAEIQQLTDDDLPNKIVGQGMYVDDQGLYIDDNDKLYLFYSEGVRDTITGFVYDHRLFYITKEKEEEWSQPEEIETPVYIIGQNRKSALGMDTKTGIIHIFYWPYPLYNTLYYTNSNVPNWEFVKIDSLDPEQGQKYCFLVMAFDTLGNVHLIWDQEFDSTSCNWYNVMYANNSTGEWVKQQVSPPIWLGGGGSGPSYLTVQKNGAVHIVYNQDPYCGLDCEAFYVRNDSLNSTDWITDTVPKPSRPLWGYGACGMRVGVNDRVHLITVGCIEEDCAWPGRTRTFYYYKQAEDSIWQGPEQIPDTAFGARIGIDQLFIDKDGIPYASYFFSSNEVYFTDRKQGSWQVPYMLVGWQHEAPESLMVTSFSFVLDSQGKGHGAFSASDMSQGFWDDGSSEIYYLSSSSSGVNTEDDHKIFHFNLFQNYPNPFNSSTIITYEVEKAKNVTLKIYDILGREVRELVNRSQKRGHYEVNWDGKNNQGKEVSSGIYFYQLNAGNYKETRKLVLIK